MLNELRPEYVEFTPDDPAEGVLYISEEYETAIHKCPCGCGNEVVTPTSGETSASIMLYPDERGTNKELPFVLGVSHSVDKNEREGFLQIPTMNGDRTVRYYTFGDLIRALDAASELDKLTQRVAALEAGR